MPHEQQAAADDQAEQLDLESGRCNIQEQPNGGGDISRPRVKSGGGGGGVNSSNSSDTATSRSSSNTTKQKAQRRSDAAHSVMQQQNIKTPEEDDAAASERLLEDNAQFQLVIGQQFQEMKPKSATAKATNEVPDGVRAGGRARRTIFINPSGHVCYWWSAVVSVAFLYNFWSASYRFAFGEIDSTTYVVWLSIDLIAELIYYLDILVNNKTGFLKDGVLQRDSKLISAHYQESNLFYLDVFCILPFDILYLSFGYNSIFRCNRLVKIYKFWSFIDRTERHTNYPNLFRTCTLVHNILVIFHWNACIFHMISTKKIIDIGQLYRIDDDHCKGVACQYLHAFYWSTLAIVGNLPQPKKRGEYIYVILELIFGLILFAWVLGHVANIVTNVSAARKEFQARLDAVKTFMRTRRVSDELQTKVIRWFDYLWSSQKSSDEERSVACLPDRLKAEIAIHVNLNTLKRVDIFQATEVGFLRELVLRLKPVLFSPGDYVCRKDEAGHEMYIVSKGRLEVVTDEAETRVVATFTAGSYFGEIAVLNVGAAGNKRTASVRSVGYSDLFCLSKRDLWDVLKDYPLAEARIRAVAEERLSALSSGNRSSGFQSGSSGPKRARSSYNTATTSTSSNRLRRLSQRSGRSRVQPIYNWDQQQQAQECLGTNLLPQHALTPLLPLSTDQTLGGVRGRLRARNSAGSHRLTATGSEFPTRKCTNSRTMEPICGTIDCNAGRPNVLVRSMNETASRQAAAASGCRHQCRHHSAASVGCHTSELQHCQAFHQANDQDEAFAPDSEYERTGQRHGKSFNFVASSPWKSSSQSKRGGGGGVGNAPHAHHLSVQQPAHLLGLSRSFECSPLGGAIGVEWTPELLQQANRSRSGAALLPPRMAPLQLSPRPQPKPQAQHQQPPPPPPLQITDERNQTMDLNRADCFSFDSSTSCAHGRDCGNQLASGRPVDMEHRAHLCLHQERPSLSSLVIASGGGGGSGDGGQLRARSSSMNTRPQLYDHERALPNVSDYGHELVRGFDECDRHANYSEDDDDGDEEGNWPAGVSVTRDTLHHQRGQQARQIAPEQQLGRRQRHRSDCRHHQRSQQQHQHHQHHHHHHEQQQQRWRQTRRQNAEVDEHDQFEWQQTNDSPIMCSSSSTATLTSGGGGGGHQPPYGAGARITSQLAAGAPAGPLLDDSSKPGRNLATATDQCGATSSEHKQLQQQQQQQVAAAGSPANEQQGSDQGDLFGSGQEAGSEPACRVEMGHPVRGDGSPPDGELKKRRSDP